MSLNRVDSDRVILIPEACDIAEYSKDQVMTKVLFICIVTTAPIVTPSGPWCI